MILFLTSSRNISIDVSWASAGFPLALAVPADDATESDCNDCTSHSRPIVEAVGVEAAAYWSPVAEEMLACALDVMLAVDLNEDNRF